MELFITMPVINDIDVFGFFLMTSSFFMFTCFLYQLYRHKQIPIWKSSTLCFIAALFTLAGGRLFTITIDGWQSFLNSGVFPVDYKISILGAIAFGPVGILIGKRMLRIRGPLLDCMAIPVLIAMAIQRLGCLFSGCCGGIVTNSNFGLSYAPFTTAHKFCAQNGTLDALESYTPPLQPVQFYLMVVCLLSAIVIYLSHNKFKAAGSRFMFAITLFLSGRFIVEYWREPLTEGAFGNIMFGLKVVQWLLMVACFILLLIIYFREKYATQPVNVEWNKPDVFDKALFYNGLKVLILFSCIFFIIQSFFSPAERTVLILFTAISFCLCGAVYINNIYVPGYRYAAGGIAMMFLILFLPIIAQVPKDSSKAAHTSYKEISFGTSMYEYEHFHDPAFLVTANNTYTDCNGQPYTSPTSYLLYGEKYHHQLYTGTIGFAQYFDYGNYKHAFYKLYGVGGMDKCNDDRELDGKQKDWLMNIQIGGGFERKYIAMSTKINIGRLRGEDKKTGDKDNSLTAGFPDAQVTPPSITMRLGFVKYVYFDMRLGTNTYGLNTNTPYPWMLGLGSGLGSDNGNYLRFNIGGASGGTTSYGMGTKFNIRSNAFELDFQQNQHKDFGTRNYFALTYSRFIGRKFKTKNKAESKYKFF